MQGQDVQNIEGFEDGKGEKLNIRKNQTMPQDTLFNANNSKDSGGLSVFVKILGCLFLLGSVAFVPATLHVNQLFWIGTAACFSMFVFCFVFSSIIDNIASKKSELSFTDRGINDNLSCIGQNHFLSTNDEEKNTNISSQVKYDKNSYHKAKNNACDVNKNINL